MAALTTAVAAATKRKKRNMSLASVSNLGSSIVQLPEFAFGAKHVQENRVNFQSQWNNDSQCSISADIDPCKIVSNAFELSHNSQPCRKLFRAKSEMLGRAKFAILPSNIGTA